MPPDESFSWLKLLRGPTVGKNYAKALVTTFCQLVIVALVGGLIFTVWTLRGGSSHKSENKLRDNSGTFSQEDSHDAVTENHYHFPLSDLFSFGSKGKRVDNRKKEEKMDKENGLRLAVPGETP